MVTGCRKACDVADDPAAQRHDCAVPVQPRACEGIEDGVERPEILEILTVRQAVHGDGSFTQALHQLWQVQLRQCRVGNDQEAALRKQLFQECAVREQSLTDDDRVAADPKIDVELLHQCPEVNGQAAEPRPGVRGAQYKGVVREVAGRAGEPR